MTPLLFEPMKWIGRYGLHKASILIPAAMPSLQSPWQTHLKFSIQVRNWKTGSEVATDDFEFKNPTNAEKVELEDLKGMEDLPSNFTKGETK